MRLRYYFLAIVLVFGGHSALAADPLVLSGADLPPGVIAPEAIKTSLTIYYPPGAVRCGLEGDATVGLLVDEQGNVSDVRLEKATGYAWLDDAAVASVKQWRYKPATKNGVAIPSRISTVVSFKMQKASLPCQYLPPSAYSGGLPPNFSPVPPPDSTPLKPGEQLLAQGEIRLEPGMLSDDRAFHVPDGGKTLRVNYSINPPSAGMRLLIVTDQQHREESRGSTPSGKYPLDCTVSGRGTQSTPLEGGDYWIVWIFGDTPKDRIISYREVLIGN
ncbi:MAG TPA: energy transducer TonB [Rhizomicrobium sp.]|nr:energy transducer TonB [Rhizomicrobium sp.]